MSVTSTELKFLSIIWQNEPLSSRELVRIAKEELGWQKSTTYTMLKRLGDKGLLVNDNAIVHSLHTKEEIQQDESNTVVHTKFDGSLANFVLSFLSSNRITKEEYDELKRIIDSLGG